MGPAHGKPRSSKSDGPLPCVSDAPPARLPRRCNLTERSWPFITSLVVNAVLFSLLFLPLLQSSGAFCAPQSSFFWITTDSIASEPIVAPSTSNPPAERDSTPDETAAVPREADEPEPAPPVAAVPEPGAEPVEQEMLMPRALVAEVRRQKADEEQRTALAVQARMEEQAKQATEEQARQEQARLKAEQEQLRRETQEKERLAAELAKQRLKQQKLEQERFAKAEQARLAAEQARQEKASRELEQARQKAEQERLAAEQARQEQLKRERLEQERQAQAEQARLATERARQEKVAREWEQARQRAEQERLAAEQARQERLKRERLEQERQAQAEQARLAAERARQEKVARELEQARQRAEQERLAAEQSLHKAKVEPAAIKPIQRPPEVVAQPKGPQQDAKNPPQRIGLPQLKGDLKLVVTAARVPKTTVSYRDFPLARRNRPFTRAEARREAKLVPVVARPDANVHEVLIEQSRPGVYIFSVDGNAEMTVALKLFEGTPRAMVKTVPIASGSTGKLLVRVLMPEGIVWDDDRAFSGSIEDAEGVTKFRADTGLMWKEYK